MCIKTPKPPKESQDAKAARAAQLKGELDERTRLKTEATEAQPTTGIAKANAHIDRELNMRFGRTKVN